MKERPILMSAPMVRACLDGSKTQTRRAIRVQPPAATTSVSPYHHPRNESHGPHFFAWGPDPTRPGNGYIQPDWCLPCPYGDRGDHLYVRETWQHSNSPDGPWDPTAAVFYRADYMDDPLGPDLERSPDGIRRKWIPSIHMPRLCSRITLEVTEVRVERLQEISEEDAKAEGIEPIDKGIWWKNYVYPGGPQTETLMGEPIAVVGFRDPRKSYSTLWDQINGADAWDANPWVWVVEFKRVKP